MSCVNPDSVAGESAGVGAQLDEHERFRAEVAEGLHALAQPLTILRSAIAMLAMGNENGGDHGRYMDMSARQIERACALFSCVQGLVASKRSPAKPAPIDIGSLTMRIIEDRSQALDALGISLDTALPALPAMAFGDPQRTEQALSAAFETVVSVSAAGDVVKLGASASERFWELTFESTSKQDNNLKSSDRLRLSLAKQNILSQQGRYEFTVKPFRILLALPVHAFEVHQSELKDNKNLYCTAHPD